MNFTPEPGNSLDELDMDVRSVSVIWAEGAPKAHWSGCSPFEAIGLLESLLDQMIRNYRVELPDSDYELDYDEDDE